MTDINTERSGSILRVELNRPAKKNAMTAAMYAGLAEIFNDAAKDEAIHVVLWHGAGDLFCAGNFPQGLLMEALIGFEKPIVAAVQGAAIGGGTTMLMHCDFIYAGESAKFQLPFINLGLVPEFGSSYSVPSRIGHLRAAELVLLGDSFTAARAAELGLVTRVVPDRDLFATASAIAQKLAVKPSGALRASKRLLKQASIGQLRDAALKIEPPEFFDRLRSAEAKEAFSAFLEKRPPNFNKTTTPVAAE